MAMNFDFYLFLLKDFPHWFYSFSGIIDIAGVIVALLISLLGYKAYKITEEKKYKYFFWGFLFLALNFAAHVTLNTILEKGTAKLLLDPIYAAFVGPLFWLYYFLLIGIMLAYLSLAVAYSGMKLNKNIILFYVWALALGSFTITNSTQFNIITAIPLSFIVFFTFNNYLQDKKLSKLFVPGAFFCLFLFHMFAALETLNIQFYVVRYVILLIGLILLSIPLIKIYGRKKK